MPSSLAVFGVKGLRSRELLAILTDADLGDGTFPVGTSQSITLGYSTVRATRITDVGELGWESYVPAEFAVGDYEDLMAAGAQFGVTRSRLLRDRVASLGEGLPGVRQGTDAR